VNLLDLARMQSEGVRLNREWHMLDEIVGSALAHSAGVLAGRDVSADLPADLPLIDVDALLIERVLMNLLDNAAKYAGADAAVAVRARVFGETLYVFVEDDGPASSRATPSRCSSRSSASARNRRSAAWGSGSRVPQHRQRARRLDPRGAA
jgi:K+-sensing histidine kinase KdpD